MPGVFADSTLMYGQREIKAKVLLNTGGLGVGLVIPGSLSAKLGLKATDKMRIEFGGKSYWADVCKIKFVVRKKAEERGAELESAVLPDAVLRRPLLGVEGLEKLRIIPDVTTGEVIFK